MLQHPRDQLPRRLALFADPLRLGHKPLQPVVFRLRQVRERRLAIALVRAQKIVTLLLRDKTLIKISPELVFHRAALESLRQQMAAQKTKSAKIDVSAFKELTGVSRKYAIPLLEYLDREHVTRRVGDAREIL